MIFGLYKCLCLPIVEGLVRDHPCYPTHGGRVTHLCDSKLTIIGSNNDLSPDRRQAIISTNVGVLLTGPLEINFHQFIFEIHTFPFKKIHFTMSSGKWRSFCFRLNMLMYSIPIWSKYILCSNRNKTIYKNLCETLTITEYGQFVFDSSDENKRFHKMCWNATFLTYNILQVNVSAIILS